MIPRGVPSAGEGLAAGDGRLQRGAVVDVRREQSGAELSLGGLDRHHVRQHVGLGDHVATVDRRELVGEGADVGRVLRLSQRRLGGRLGRLGGGLLAVGGVALGAGVDQLRRCAVGLDLHVTGVTGVVDDPENGLQLTRGDPEVVERVRDLLQRGNGGTGARAQRRGRLTGRVRRLHVRAGVERDDGVGVVEQQVGLLEEDQLVPLREAVEARGELVGERLDLVVEGLLALSGVEHG